jgi:hypothetical protein
LTEGEGTGREEATVEEDLGSTIRVLPELDTQAGVGAIARAGQELECEWLALAWEAAHGVVFEHDAKVLATEGGVEVKPLGQGPVGALDLGWRDREALIEARDE